MNTPNIKQIMTRRSFLKLLLIPVFAAMIVLLIISHKTEPAIAAVLLSFTLGFVIGKQKNNNYIPS
jgi:predicted permease